MAAEMGKWELKSWSEEVVMNVEQFLKTKGAEVTIVGPEKTIGATARLLAERNKGLALVCDAGDKLLGVVSVIDLSRAVGEFAERAPAMAVETIMTTDFAFCRFEDSVEDVLQKMTERSIRHLPVVQDGVLKGLLNMRGVLESRFEEAEIRTDEMRKYIFGIGYH
jgi:CBS domain-containing protein